MGSAFEGAYRNVGFTLRRGEVLGVAGVIGSGREELTRDSVRLPAADDRHYQGGSPDLANQLLLPAIAAVIFGGTAITGGVGSIGRTVVGALIVSIVRIGMTYVGVDIFAQQIVFGAALIFAVFVTIDRSKVPIIR